MTVERISKGVTMTDKPDRKRHPWIALACIALGAVTMLVLIGYFTIVFPVEKSAAKMQSDLGKAFPNVEFVAGRAVESDSLRQYIFVEVSFVGDERNQLEMRNWLARWKLDHELTVPIVLRFRDPKYPIDPEHPRWLNHFAL
jgi:hypothetical protein